MQRELARELALQGPAALQAAAAVPFVKTEAAADAQQTRADAAARVQALQSSSLNDVLEEGLDNQKCIIVPRHLLDFNSLSNSPWAEALISHH